MGGQFTTIINLSQWDINRFCIKLIKLEMKECDIKLKAETVNRGDFWEMNQGWGETESQEGEGEFYFSF